MKKKSFIKKLVTSFLCVVTMVSCFYTISLMTNDNNVKAMEQEKDDLLMLSEAYKWIDKEDIDPSTGKLKEGVIYNIGENNRFYTSEGFKKYNIQYTNETDSISPLVEYRTTDPIIKVNKVEERNDILFSNNFMVDFDLTSDDEGNVNLERRKYKLVNREYTQSSHNEQRRKLVWKSKKVKVGWFKVTIYYLDWQYYTEKVVETTAIETYDEVIEPIGSINMSQPNVLTNFIAEKIASGFKTIGTYALQIGESITTLIIDALMFQKDAMLQLLSLIADFIPVLDEIKTSFETIKGKDMFTGESIGTFWRIFGAITLAVSAVVFVITSGVGSFLVDAITDLAQSTKKASKVVKKGKNAVGAVETVLKTMKKVENIDGMGKVNYRVAKLISKNADAFQMLVDKGADVSKLSKTLKSTKGSKLLKNVGGNLDNLRNLSKIELDALINNPNKYIKLANSGENLADAIRKDFISEMAGTLSGVKLDYLKKNPQKLTKALDSGADPKQIGMIFERASSQKDMIKKLDLIGNNADAIKSMSQKGRNLAIRNIGIYDDLAKQGKNANEIFGSLADATVKKSNNINLPNGLKGKTYEIEGVSPELWEINATQRGTLLDDVFGNSVNDSVISGNRTLKFSDGTTAVYEPLGGSAPDCDNLVTFTKNGKSETHLVSRKSMNLDAYNNDQLVEKLDEYYDALEKHKRSYNYAQRTGETGVGRPLMFGEDYNKITLELDINKYDKNKLDKIAEYFNGKDKDIYDIIVNVVGK